MALLNYTTTIDPDKTAGEITRILSSHGASAVLTEYDQKDGYVSALSFQIKRGDVSMGFRLPCDWNPVLGVLTGQWQAGKIRGKRPDQLQAVRVAWRIVKDWTEAQMALVETQMVTTQDVFLPYLVLAGGKTLAETVAADPKFLLGPGE